MKNQLKLLYVLGALMLTCMSFAKTPEKGAEAISAEMEIAETQLHNVQQAAKKVDRIFLVVYDHPQGRLLRYALEGELLERVREIVGCLKINPNYRGAKRNHIFEKWSPSLEIDQI